MRIVKAKDKQEMDKMVEEYIQLGYSLKTQTENSATVVKRYYGKWYWHVLLLLTFVIGNIIYAAYCYSAKSDEVLIKTT